MSVIDKKRLIKANFTSVVTSDNLSVSKTIGGSASIIMDENDNLVRYVNSTNKTILSKNKVKCIVLIGFAHHVAGDTVRLDLIEFTGLEMRGFVRRFEHEFKLNKPKLRGKILAYANLHKSSKFMAFYSISFPKGLSDQTIRKIHNTVLTRLRKRNDRFSYIWIAERQRNGTLHFHVLTNTFFNVRIVNYMYAKAIHNQLMKNPESGISFDYKKYNGCDVKKVISIPALSKYLVKYVTKNNDKMNGLLWNCDSSVSALVTHLYLTEDEFNQIANKIIYMFTKDIKTSFENSYISFDIYNYGSYRPKIIFDTLKMVNNHIIKTFF